MRYDIAKLPIRSLLRPIADAGVALARLDERVARSPVGEGWIERSHFADAFASLWTDGQLVHLEDLVLHDAGQDVRTPTHEPTIARDVLRARRRIASQPPGWALSLDGLRSLRGVGAESGVAVGLTNDTDTPIASSVRERSASAGEGEAGVTGLEDPLAAELTAIDAVLARSEAVIMDVRSARSRGGQEKDALVYDLDWDVRRDRTAWSQMLNNLKRLQLT
jgi:hypothetical protein